MTRLSNRKRRLTKVDLQVLDCGSIALVVPRTGECWAWLQGAIAFEVWQKCPVRGRVGASGIVVEWRYVEPIASAARRAKFAVEQLSVRQFDAPANPRKQIIKKAGHK